MTKDTDEYLVTYKNSESYLWDGSKTKDTDMCLVTYKNSKSYL